MSEKPKCNCSCHETFSMTQCERCHCELVYQGVLGNVKIPPEMAADCIGTPEQLEHLISSWSTSKVWLPPTPTGEGGGGDGTN